MNTDSLKPGNACMNSALKVAMGATHRLNDAGATVLDICVRGGTPILRIDRQPAFVSGSAMVSRNNGLVRERVFVARYHGAQIEWTESTPRRLAQAIGGAP